MLKITKNVENSTLTFSVDGRLDTITAPQLETEIKDALDGVSQLVLNLEKLEYISSAGLRVLLSAQKKMNAQGKMKVINVQKSVMDIFEITGFADILTIE